MKLSEVITHFEEQFPKKYAYEWDNVGLLCGDMSQEVRRVFVTLDVTKQTLQEAIEKKADCIFSHHPLIFSGIKQITTETTVGEILMLAMKNGISIYAAHTNLDTAPGGINAVLAQKFGLKNAAFIEQNPAYPEAGLGVIGEIEPVGFAEFCEAVKRILNTPFVRVCGDVKTVARVAIGSGSCSDLAPMAQALGADVLITGDLKYHTALDEVQNHFTIIDAGHFPTEELSKEIFKNCFKSLGVEIVDSEQKDVFYVM